MARFAIPAGRRSDKPLGKKPRASPGGTKASVYLGGHAAETMPPLRRGLRSSRRFPLFRKQVSSPRSMSGVRSTASRKRSRQRQAAPGSTPRRAAAFTTPSFAGTSPMDGRRSCRPDGGVPATAPAAPACFAVGSRARRAATTPFPARTEFDRGRRALPRRRRQRFSALLLATRRHGTISREVALASRARRSRTRCKLNRRNSGSLKAYFKTRRRNPSGKRLATMSPPRPGFRRLCGKQANRP